MNTQVNWQRIRNEFQRLTDVETLKDEVQRIGTEIRRFDLQSVLSPAAQTKVKQLEKRYSELLRTIHQAQRQMDREFNRILRNIKVHRSDVSKIVNQQKNKLERVSTDFKKRFAKVAKTTAKTPGYTTTTMKAATGTAKSKTTKAKTKTKAKTTKKTAAKRRK